MTAPNHALTGAVIGLTIHEPLLAAPLAFLSHFACDAIPHYDPPTQDGVARLSSKKFIREFLILGGALCLVLVIVLAIAQPKHWVLAAVCAFLAASPDLFWIPRFIHIMRTHKDIDMTKRNWFSRFHSFVQWKTGPQFLSLEAVWFVAFSAFVASQL